MPVLPRHCERLIRLLLLSPLIALACSHGAHAAAAPQRLGTKLLPPAVMASLRQSGLPMSSFGFYVQSVEGDPALAALNAEQPYVMASTTKVVTSLAALDMLGSSYRWRTYAYLQGELRNGRLNGDLLIVGGGNARLSVESLQQWFAQMRAQGLREINGNIVLDRYAFQLSDSDHANTPLPSTNQPHHMWPDAFTVNEGVLDVELSSARNGRPAVVMEPRLAGVKLINAVSSRGGCSAHAGFANQGGQMSLRVSGSWASDCGEGNIRMVPLSHGQFATLAIAALWADAGGVLRGRVVDNAVSHGSAVVQYDALGNVVMPWSYQLSERLPDVIREINKTSDNVAARNLLLSLSPGFPARAATLSGARERVQHWLALQGLQAGDIAIDNGSGLSRTERATPHALVLLLLNAWRSPVAEAFIGSLPIAGVDGTLARRMRHGEATGHAFLKTGTLHDTRALAGYVRGRSGRMYAVAAMVNHPAAARGTPVLDSLIEWLAENG